MSARPSPWQRSPRPRAPTASRVAVCKPAQTGVTQAEPGDLATVTALVGDLPTAEVARYPEPLAPETAARRCGAPSVTLAEIVDAVVRLAEQVDLVLVEGAGGVLVRLAPDLTLLDVAVALHAPVVVVTDPGLGTLNHTELTIDALRAAGVTVSGLVIGSWPQRPDLAMRCNLEDLPRLTGSRVLGILPRGAGDLEPADFRTAAPGWWQHAPWSRTPRNRTGWQPPDHDVSTETSATTPTGATR